MEKIFCIKHIRINRAIVMSLLLASIVPLNASALPKDRNANTRYIDRRYTAFQKDSLLLSNILIDTSQTFLLKRPMFISAKYSGGKTLVKKEKLDAGYAQYGELKIGVTSLGNRWQDIVYGMPYYGLGVGFYDFHSGRTGNPISVYLLQGGTLKTLSIRSGLKYEFNFGTSFNWRRYHPVNNPDNECIGTPMNIYFAVNLYYNHALSKSMDINAGIAFNHVSNGATRTPNYGVNTISAFIELSYYFERERIANEFNPTLRAPEYEYKRLISDITINSTVRQRKYNTEETGLSLPYIDKKFHVINASYALLHMPNYKYRYGLGVDVVYDESAGATVKKIGIKPDGRELAEVNKSDFIDRMGVGISAHGEIVQPKYSVSVLVGYEFIRGKKQDHRLYQAFSVRIPLLQNVYGAFTVRSQKFSNAQYMFFGLGYMIDHKPFKKAK